jgi:hypothetical protein
VSALSDPETLKSLGFWLLVIGLAGDIAVLFIPSRKRSLEKSLAVLFIVVIITGVVIDRVGDSILADRSAPRSLNEAQQASIAERLRSFGKHEMFVYPISDIDPEVGGISRDLSKVCSRADWSYCGFDPSFWPAVPQLFRSPQRGLLILVSPAAPDPTVKPAADMLASELRNEGMQAVVSTAFSGPQPAPDNHLRVFVYMK